MVKILLATDGSPHATAAVSAVSSQEWPEGSHVRVVAVADAPIGKLSTEQAQTVLSEAAEALSKRFGTKFVETEVLQGRPQKAILEQAENWKPDLVAVGSYGHTGPARMLLGSVTDTVLNQIQCSIFVARCTSAPAKTSETNGKHHFFNVLIGVDGSDCSAAAVKAVAARPWAEGTIFTVATVFEPELKDYSPNPKTDWKIHEEHEAESAHQTEKLLEPHVAELKRAISGCKVEEKVISDIDTADALVNLAQSMPADLLVVGSHGRTGLDRVLLGSVSYAVVAEAPCSVLVVK